MSLRRSAVFTLFLIPLWVIFACDSTSPPVPPIANAGPDQPNANVDQPVSLNGSGSSDPRDKPLTYAWSFLSRPAGSAATLSGASTAVASFTPDVGGSYVIQLTVDNGKLTATDDCTITVNGRPIAEAGEDKGVTLGASVQLNGAGSSDPEGDPLTYEWTFLARPAGSIAVLSDPSSARPTFTADVAGDYEIRLVVSDGSLDSDPDECVVSANTPPLANAGPDQTTIVKKFFQLDGSGSSDANGDPLSYSWSMNSKPAFSVSTLTNPNTVNPGFTPDPVGEYVFSLVVNDGKANSDPDYVTITAEPIPPPHADAGPDQDLWDYGTVQLDGSGSWDEYDLPLTYAWSFLDRPDGSSATLTDPASVKPTFYADVDGIYRVWLVVSNGPETSSDEVRIRVIPEIKTGLYEGTTSQDMPVEFVVSEDEQGDPFVESGFEIIFRAAGTGCAYWGWYRTLPVLKINDGRFGLTWTEGFIEGWATSSTTFVGSAEDSWPAYGCTAVAVDWDAARTGSGPVSDLVAPAEKGVEVIRTPIRREDVGSSGKGR